MHTDGETMLRNWLCNAIVALVMSLSVRSVHSATVKLLAFGIFGRPATQPRYARGIPETWWYDREKAAKIDQ